MTQIKAGELTKAHGLQSRPWGLAYCYRIRRPVSSEKSLETGNRIRTHRAYTHDSNREERKPHREMDKQTKLKPLRRLYRAKSRHEEENVSRAEQSRD